MSAESVSHEFIVNQITFWLSLIVAVGAAAGIGFKVASYLRKKVNEDKNELREEIKNGLARNRETLETYIKNIAEPAALRRDKMEILIEAIGKRVEALEQQQAMQLQLVLQNQTAIREFISEEKEREKQHRDLKP